MEEFYLRKRITALILAFLSTLLLCPGVQAASAAQPEEDYIAAIHTRSNGQPYYIMVNRAQNTVTVYGLDSSGYYTIPVKAMVCSVGREGHATPSGTFTIGGRWTWLHMVDGSYGQYATQISGNILFHSVCYTRRDPSTLMTFEYNALGERASLGCVRLQTADAKWIYDNCARGTKVTVYDGNDPGPLGKPSRTVDYITESMDNGWDPTDPREDNPWLASPPPDQPVTYDLLAQALYQMAGVTGGDPFLWASESGVLSGMFGPNDRVTRQELIAALYRYETEYLGRPASTSGSLARFSDAQAVQTANQSAMRWAVGEGLIQGTSATTLHPSGYAIQIQLDTILQRYAKLR